MTDTPENFANHPASITEIKGDKENNAATWKPRDALIATLRDIDSGKIKPNALVIVYSEILEEKGYSQTSWAAAGATLIHTLGMLSYAATRIVQTAAR